VERTRDPETALRELLTRWSVTGPQFDTAAADQAVRELTSAANVVCHAGRRGTALLVEARRLSLVIAETAFGFEAVATSYPRRVLADELIAAGLHSEADQLLVEDLACVERRSPDDLREVAGAVYALAKHRTDEAREGAPTAEALIERLRDLVMRDARVRRDYELLLVDLKAEVARQTGDANQLVKAALASVDAMRRKVGARHPDYAITVMQLGELYTRLGRHADAERTLVSAREVARGSELEGWVLRALADLEEARGRPEDALAFLDAVDVVWKHKYDAPREMLAEQRQRLETRTAGSGSSSSPLRMRHPRLGVGVVISREQDRVRLRMQDGSERVFLADRLEPE
jgi:hypothetical protein